MAYRVFRFELPEGGASAEYLEAVSDKLNVEVDAGDLRVVSVAVYPDSMSQTQRFYAVVVAHEVEDNTESTTQASGDVARTGPPSDAEWDAFIASQE